MSTHRSPLLDSIFADDDAQQRIDLPEEYQPHYEEMVKQASAQGIDLNQYTPEQIASALRESVQAERGMAGAVPTPEQAGHGIDKLAGAVPTPEQAGHSTLSPEEEGMLKMAYLQGQAMWAGFQDAANEPSGESEISDEDFEKVAQLHAEDLLLYTGRLRSEEMIKHASARKSISQVGSEMNFSPELMNAIGERAGEYLAANGWDVDAIGRDWQALQN